MEIFGEEVLASIGVVGSMISGIVGGCIYNAKWSSGRSCGYHKWWEYVLSILSSLGFSVGFGIAMLLVIIALCIIAFVLALIFVASVIIGIINGVLYET